MTRRVNCSTIDLKANESRVDMLGSGQGQSLTFLVRHVFLRRRLQSCELRSSRRTLRRWDPDPQWSGPLLPLSRRWTRTTQSAFVGQERCWWTSEANWAHYGSACLLKRDECWTRCLNELNTLRRCQIGQVRRWPVQSLGYSPFCNLVERAGQGNQAASVGSGTEGQAVGWTARAPRVTCW